MKIFAVLRVAARALRRNIMRTILTMLGMIIGVGAVIATVSLGNGAKAQVEAQIASLGQNVILIFSGSFTRGGVRGGQLMNAAAGYRAAGGWRGFLHDDRWGRASLRWRPGPPVRLHGPKGVMS